MSNRCFLSSFTLRLYLLIFWSSVECRGLEKCCPVDKDCCVCNPTLSARVFSGTNCCTLAPHCHPDLHHCNNTAPRPRRWSTLISWTASPLLCRCRWPATSDGDDGVMAKSGSVLSFASFPAYISSFFWHTRVHSFQDLEYCKRCWKSKLKKTVCIRMLDDGAGHWTGDRGLFSPQLATCHRLHHDADSRHCVTTVTDLIWGHSAYYKQWVLWPSDTSSDNATSFYPGFILELSPNLREVSLMCARKAIKRLITMYISGSHTRSVGMRCCAVLGRDDPGSYWSAARVRGGDGNAASGA